MPRPGEMRGFFSPPPTSEASGGGGGGGGGGGFLSRPRAPPPPPYPPPAAARGEGNRLNVGRGRANRTCTQLHERRQESRQRLAGPGRRDQQRRAPGAREAQQFELMRARRPPARGKPAREDFRQFGGTVEHPIQVTPAPRLVIAAPVRADPERVCGFLCARRPA